VIELASQVRALEDDVYLLIHTTDMKLYPDLHNILAIITKNIKTIHTLFETLDHEEALKWISWHYRHDIRLPFTPIKGYLGILQRGLLAIQWTPEQEACLNQAVERINSIVRTISEFLQEASDSYLAKLKTDVIKTSPQEALAPVWSIARYILRDRPFNLSLLIPSDLAPIYYSPLYTTSLLERFFRLVGEQQNLSGVVSASLKGEPEFCAFSLGVQGLCMTPALWEQAQQSFYYGDEVERLRELGGSIEPLVWDEGQGQGVIVRLPWAST
jgi:hypothetical protein